MSQLNMQLWTVKFPFRELKFNGFMQALDFTVKIYGKHAMHLIDICYSKQQITPLQNLKGVVVNGRPRVVLGE